MADRDSGRRTHRGRATRAVHLSGITPCSVWSAPQPWMAAQPRHVGVRLDPLAFNLNRLY
eukprot:6687285-Prymnesium_polylepis.1